MDRLTQKVEALGDIWLLENGKTKEMVTDSKEYKEYFEKLAEYEELEEQGLLIRLPCKVGDTVYEPRPDRGFISVYEITLITISGKNIFYKWMLVDGIYSNLDGFSNDKIGKTVFLTYEEAEKKLKELQKEGALNEQIS